MAARPTTLISVDGGPLAPGNLTLEYDGLLHWHGDVRAFHHPKRSARIIVVTDHRFYLGEALINHASLPDEDSDEPPVTRFVGNGKLHRKDLREIAELLFPSVAEQAR